MRLLGAGSVLKHAIAELQALPEEAPERRFALPVTATITTGRADRSCAADQR